MARQARNAQVNVAKKADKLIVDRAEMAKDLDTAIVDGVEEVDKTTADIAEKPVDPDRSTTDKPQAQNRYSRRSSKSARPRNTQKKQTNLGTSAAEELR